LFDICINVCDFSHMSARKITSPHQTLSKRERQIMDILYRLGRATAGEVMAALSTDKTYSTIRSQLRTLEEKGHVRHEEHGLRYVYIPTMPRHAVRQPALKHLIDTFFGGSAEKVVSALIGTDASNLSNEELDRIALLIEKARKERK
jgi:BlaI family transcriptional regulator, penicillinase repressor